MGGMTYHHATQQSQTEPWSVHSMPPRQITPEFRPLWKELPWHLEHPALFAFLAGISITAALWLLTAI